MSTVADKADDTRTLLHDPDVRDVLNHVNDFGETGLAAMEVMLLELALSDLDQHRAEIEAHFNPDVKKFYRAFAKTVMDSQVPREVWESFLDGGGREMITKAEKRMEVRGGKLKVWVEDYDRKTGHVKGHWRNANKSERNSEQGKALLDAYKQSQKEDWTLGEGGRRGTGTARARADEQAFEDLGGEAFAGNLGRFDKITNAGEKVWANKGAIRAFLEQSSFGGGILAVADFFIKTGSTFVFAARAIRNYGPIAGAQLAAAYYRYGGYEVGLTFNKKGQLMTEFGDNLDVYQGKEITSLKQRRQHLVDVLSRRLPDRRADQAGAEPPSEGFIIDRNGNVIAHAVGRGNDHYLPFNARQLRRMRKADGGEYIRRRMFGGPTTEDLHAAMMMGAERLTVVSNSGTFSISLTGRSRGLKLEHGQIVNRYKDLMEQRSGNLNFNAYDYSIAALIAEFPLHFHRGDADSQRGAWADDNDRIRSKVSVMDQIRALFGAEKPGSPREQERVSNTSVEGRPFRGEAPKTVRESLKTYGLGDNQTIDEFLVKGGASAAQSVRAAYRRQGKTIPEDLKSRLVSIEQASRRGGSQSGPVTTRIDPAVVRNQPQQQATRITPRGQQTPPSMATQGYVAPDRFERDYPSTSNKMGLRDRLDVLQVDETRVPADDDTLAFMASLGSMSDEKFDRLYETEFFNDRIMNLGLQPKRT